MVDEKYIALINQEIDGANSPRETAMLQDHLATNAEAQQFYDEMLATASLLQEVKPVEPPAHLQHVIMNRLPVNRYGASTPTSWWAELREWWEVKFNFKYVYAFAGGLAVGVALFVLVSPTPSLDSEQLTGTMIQHDEKNALRTIKEITINRDGVTGSLAVQQSAEAVRTELALDSTQPIELTLSFDAQQFGFTSLTMLNDAALGEAILIPSAVQLTHSGRKSYVIDLIKKDRAPSKLEIKIVRAGELLEEWAIAVE